MKSITKDGAIKKAVGWRIAAAGSAALSALVARRLVRMAWRASGHDDAEDPDRRWSEAFAWAAAVGVGTAVARVVAVRGAARGWERATGEPPPGVDGKH
jgi:hypothetical protein